MYTFCPYYIFTYLMTHSQFIVPTEALKDPIINPLMRTQPISMQMSMHIGITSSDN